LSQSTFGILLDIGRVLLSLRFLAKSENTLPFSFGLVKCFTQNFIHHRN
jgi:hypothetical protein